MGAEGGVVITLNLPSTVTHEEVFHLASSYYLPLGSNFRAPEPGEVINIEGRGGGNLVAVHLDFMHDCVRFPIHPLIWHLLQATNLTPAQLSPNSYKFLFGSFIIWTRVHPNSCFTLETLLHYYTIKKDIRRWLFMSPKLKKRL